MNDMPASLSKNLQKYIRSLSSAKYRKKHNQYLIEGDKICKLMLEKSSNQIVYLLASSDWLETNTNRDRKLVEKTIAVSEKEMKSLSLLKTPTPVMIIAEKDPADIKEILKENLKAVYLDDVQDPGNVGSIIRTASWFGFDAVIRSSGSADYYNPKVIQSTMGGFFYLNLIEADLAEIKALSEDISIIGTAMDGADFTNFQPNNSSFIIAIGNEGRGMTDQTRSQLDTSLSIPGSDNVESLNASVAFGIIASRLIKQ